MDEEELSKRIVDFLNKTTLGYTFEYINSYSHIANEKNGCTLRSMWNNSISTGATGSDTQEQMNRIM